MREELNLSLPINYKCTHCIIVHVVNITVDKLNHAELCIIQSHCAWWIIKARLHYKPRLRYIARIISNCKPEQSKSYDHEWPPAIQTKPFVLPSAFVIILYIAYLDSQDIMLLYMAGFPSKLHCMSIHPVYTLCSKGHTHTHHTMHAFMQHSAFIHMKPTVWLVPVGRLSIHLYNCMQWRVWLC